MTCEPGGHAATHMDDPGLTHARTLWHPEKAYGELEQGVVDCTLTPGGVSFVWMQIIEQKVSSWMYKLFTAAAFLHFFP